MIKYFLCILFLSSIPAHAVIIFDSGGNPLNASTPTSGALDVYLTGGLPIAISTNTNGVIQNQTVTNTASSFTAPANAVGFILQSDSTNTANIRWAIGSTATASVGTLTEPGRSSDYVPCAANISVIAISDSPTISVQWILSN